MRVSIEQYITINNPNAASQLLVKYGVQPATSLQDLSQKVEMITYKYKELAFMDLANIDTPYRRLILSSNQNLLASEQLPSEPKSNCSGCGGTCGEKKSNIDSSELELPKKETRVVEPVKLTDVVVTKAENTDKYDKYIMPTIAVVGVIAVAVLLKQLKEEYELHT